MQADVVLDTAGEVVIAPKPGTRPTVIVPKPETREPDTVDAAVSGRQPRPDYIWRYEPTPADKEDALATQKEGGDLPTEFTNVAPRDAPVLIFPKWDFPRYQLRVSQKWEGTVRSVGPEGFDARLVDLTNLDSPQEEATFLLDDVSESDLKLVEPGAVFYWSIGVERNVFGQIQRVSRIRFRRLPRLSAREFQSSRNEAKDWGWMLDDAGRQGT